MLQKAPSWLQTTQPRSTAVAKLQAHDGSFELDDNVVALLRRHEKSISLRAIQQAMPQSISTFKNA